jgi:hypothetical protein
MSTVPAKHTVRTASIPILLLALLPIACAAPPKVRLDRRPTGVQPDDYGLRFKEWSRDIRVIPFNGLENILTARATFLSFRFREAFVERYAADLDASPADKEKLRAEQAAGLDAGHEFFVTLMSAVKNCDNLDPVEGPWTLRLRNDQGKEAAPSAVEEIEKPKPEYVKYYDFNPAYRKAYKVTFPTTAADGAPLLPGDTRYFELTFANALGRGAARWEIAGR